MPPTLKKDTKSAVARKFKFGEFLPQVGRSESDDRVVGDVRVLLHDDSLAGHLLCPRVDGGVRPESLVVVVAVGEGESNTSRLLIAGTRGGSEWKLT